MGSLDAAFASPGSHDWDLAAADLLVHEAGGSFTDFSGQPLRYNAPHAAHGALIAGGLRPPRRADRPGARPPRRVCIKPARSLIHGAVCVYFRPTAPAARAGPRAEQVLMPSFKRIVASPVFQGAVATAGAWYLRLVWHCNRLHRRAARMSTTRCSTPAIIAMWHGQHFLMPFIQKKNDPSHRAKVLISRHRDGEINARAAEKLGVETIRGSRRA